MTGDAGAPRWSLTLYVAGSSPRSVAALENVRRVCDEDLPGQVELRVVDVVEKPALVLADRIIAVPTLVKHLPEPLRQLVGDLGDEQRVRSGLDLGPSPAAANPSPSETAETAHGGPAAGSPEEAP